MREFVRQLLNESGIASADSIYNSNHLIQYLDLKMGAIDGNSKTRRSLANIYAIYSITHFYENDFYNKPDEYKQFEGYEYTKLFVFYRSLYGGQKLQNHALNSRVNGEFLNKFPGDVEPIIINDGCYSIHINYLYYNNQDVSKVINKIVEKYIELLMIKDSSLIKDIQTLEESGDSEAIRIKIKEMVNARSEARIFEIISYAILKNHYKNIPVYIGFTLDDIKKEYITLYKTGRTNANDGGIDFVMRPLGRFFQVTEVNNYDKYTLDMDKVLHFPITFVIKTEKTKKQVLLELEEYIKEKSSGMRVIEERYHNAIEEIITINELKLWIDELSSEDIFDLVRDIGIYYRMELNIVTENKGGVYHTYIP